MVQRQHPLSRAMYKVTEDGNVEVTAKDGTVGLFTPDGERISGDLYHVDPHLCGWLAGPQLPPRLAVLPRFRQTSAAAETAETETPSGEMVEA